MVQFNFSALQLKHFLVAAKTGLLTGILFIIVAEFITTTTAIASAVLLAMVTTIADFIVHPTHFGEPWTEAVCTGIGAGVLCYTWTKGLPLLKRRIRGDS